MVQVIQAGSDHFEKVWDLLMEFREKYHNEPINKRVAQEALRKMLKEDIVFIASDGGEAVGLIIGQLIVHPMLRGYVGQELAWYSTTPCSGIRLLKAFEEKCYDEGADYVSMSTLHNNPGVGRILERRGYRPIEIGWRKDLD